MTEEDLDKVRNLDMSVMGAVPYFIAFCVMPLNFIEFWDLMKKIDDYRGSRDKKEDFNRTKWKISF